MKRILSLLILIAILFTFAACGGTPANDETKDTGDNASDTTDAVVVDKDFKYKHVVIVGIDGMGAFHKNADTPNIDAIFADYALTDVAQVYKPVASGPSWLSVFTGIDPVVMRTTINPSLSNTGLMQRYFDAVKKYPTLFSMFHEKYPESKVASIARFEALDDVFAAIGDYVYIGGTNPVDWTTEEEKNNALAYIDTMDPNVNNFVFFYFNEPDSTGHKQGYGSEAFNAKLTECDAALGEIFNAIEEKGMLDDTLFILTTDHGGDGTQHGDVYTPSALTVTLGFRGKTINNVKDFDMILRDVAAIVVEAMEFENSGWSGVAEPPKVPEGLFKD